MSELGYTSLTLPSQGVLYLDAEGAALIPDGIVSIRKMTTREESILLEQGTQVSDRISQIIKQCCKLPDKAVQGGLQHDDLLVSDRLAILIGLRIVTFDGRYTFQWQCDQCRAPNKAKMDLVEALDEITPKKVVERLVKKGKVTEDDAAAFVLTEPVKVKLTDAKKEVGLRFLRGKDEEKLTRFARKARSGNSPDTDVLSYRLGLQIDTVDGVKLTGSVRDEFLRSLTMRDTREIDIALDAYETGIDTTVYLDCNACGASNEKALPMTAEFFRPTEF
jgi:hypothetical protein